MVVNVVRLNCVLDEESMAHSIEGNIVENFEVVDAMGGDSTVVCLVDSVAFNDGLMNSTNHVKVDRVAT